MADESNAPCFQGCANSTCSDSTCTNSTCYNCTLNCNSCEGCNVCQKCNTGCQSDCETAQTYNGRTIASFFGDFGFNPAPIAGVTIIGPENGFFNQDSWDALATWISQRNDLSQIAGAIDTPYTDAENYLWVKESNGDGGSIVATSSVSDVSPFKASEFNRIADEVDGPNVTGAYSTADADGIGDLITASIFNQLVTAANSKAIEDGACKHCVTACDLTCDVCQKCNDPTCNVTCDSCESCDACEGCDTCEGCNACEGCDTCEGCNTCLSCNA